MISNNSSPDLAVILTKNDREATLITEQINNDKLSLMKTVKMGNSVSPYFQGVIASLLKGCHLGFYVKISWTDITTQSSKSSKTTVVVRYSTF